MFIFAFINPFFPCQTTRFQVDAVPIPRDSGIKIFVTKFNFNSQLLSIEIQGMFQISYHKLRLMFLIFGCAVLISIKIAGQALGVPKNNT